MEEKLCRQCNTIKDLAFFHNDKNKKNGKASTCKECNQKRKSTENAKRKRRESRPKHITTKICFCCQHNFQLKHSRGERDRRICYKCDSFYKSICGDSITTIIGSSVSTARIRAQKENLPFNITCEYIYSILPKNGLCPILQQPLRINTRYTITIDKIIPENGYVIGNVQILSLKANQMKNDASQEELRLFANFINRNI